MSQNVPSANVAESESHFISHGANRVHYVTAGKGNHTIVFVHGWACHLGFWREQISALADKARLILIDLPGHGQSDKPQTNYTMDFFAETVRAVLRDAKVDKAIFIGHSMGGAVIARVHHHAPEKVAALISVDGLLRRLSGTPEEGQALVGPFATPQYREHAQGFISTLFPARHAATRHARRDARHDVAGPARLGFTESQRACCCRQRSKSVVAEWLRKLRPLTLAAIGLSHHGGRRTFSHARKTR
jgi:pimeloyl-ACP methyl ester carboxylesterase